MTYMRNAESKLRTVRFTPYLKDRGPRFTLTMWDTNTRDRYGKARLAYRLNMHENDRTQELFDGNDFCCSPMDAIDSDACVEAIMGFLTLRPGDTDEDYFDDYTPAQREYCEQHAESLGCEVMTQFEKDQG